MVGENWKSVVERWMGFYLHASENKMSATLGKQVLAKWQVSY